MHHQMPRYLMMSELVNATKLMHAVLRSILLQGCAHLAPKMHEIMRESQHVERGCFAALSKAAVFRTANTMPALKAYA